MSRARIGRFRRDERGAASVEFVVVAMMLFTVIFILVESGVLMVRTVMLERGLDLAVRDVRLGRLEEGDHAGLKRRICDGAFLLFADCESSISVETIAFRNTSSFLTGGGDFVGGGENFVAVECRDRREETVPPPSRFDLGGPSSIMLVRTCLAVDPFFPGFALGESLVRNRGTADGGYAIVKTTAFMREPR
jgi:Flp pilus assembly pilin Flp